MNSEKYIGLDVHQATISVAVMERGKLGSRRPKRVDYGAIVKRLIDKVSVRANTQIESASVTWPLDQQILRRPVFVPSSRADYYRLARYAGTIPGKQPDPLQRGHYVWPFAFYRAKWITKVRFEV